MMNDTNELELLRAKVANLEAALGLRNETLKATFKLTPAMNGLLALLVELPFVSDDVIRDRLCLAADSKVLVYRLRRALDGQNIEIFSRRGIGWFLDEATRKRLQAVTSEATAKAA